MLARIFADLTLSAFFANLSTLPLSFAFLTAIGYEGYSLSNSQ
jgi:ABC-type uncharacterized transport system permease subunit